MSDQDQSTPINQLLGGPPSPQVQGGYRDANMPQPDRAFPQQTINNSIAGMEHLASPPGLENFVPGFQVVKSLGIDEKMAKSLIIAIVILTIVQMPQARQAIIAFLPLMLKNGPVLRSVSVSIIVVMATFVANKVFS